MNPAILVLLWIRLSVTFGYPAAYTGLPPRIRTRERISSHPFEYDGSYSMAAAQDYEDSETIASADSKSYTSSFLSSSSSSSSDRTSPPHLVNDDSNAFEGQKPAIEPNDTSARIISIVRVSASTSVVKPKRLERVTKSVSESRNYLNIVSAANDMVDARRGAGSSSGGGTTTTNETNLENVVTPFISLLRKNRFDVYENDGPETLDLQQYAHRSASSTSASNYTTKSSSENAIEDYTSRYHRDQNNDALVVAAAAAAFHRQSKSINDTNDDVTEMVTEQYTLITETDRSSSSSSSVNSAQRKEKLSSSSALFQLYDDEENAHAVDQLAEETERNYEQVEEVYGEPEQVYGEVERVYGETEKVYGQPERVYGEPEKEYGQPEKEYGQPEADGGAQGTYDEEEKYKSETMHDEPETEEEFVKQNHHLGLGLPESSAAAANANSYSLFTTRVNDKKSSFIVDNGTHRKYRVEEKTADGFIVGEYGMVSHRDGSLRGVRYTADSNINPSLIYQTLVKFLSLK